MDKIELRIDAEQADLIIHGLALARDTAISQQHKAKYSALRNWIFVRRIKRWGDPAADAVNAAINADVTRGDN